MRDLVLGIAAAVVLGAAGAIAAPLDEAVCTGLKSERGALVEKGVESDMARGPEWAKTNLSPERLSEIARLIEVEEQLAFRCPQQNIAAPKDKKPGKSTDKAVEKKVERTGAMAKPKEEQPEAAAPSATEASAAPVLPGDGDPTPKKAAAKSKAREPVVPLRPGISPLPEGTP